MDLNTLWFLLIAFLFAGYAILDGYDLGVGVLHLFARDEKERRTHLNAIGPVWDGNEVWLITAGACLFAAFPVVYATIFSGFYIALMLLLAALIFRAVAIEFRGKVESRSWKTFWDFSFGFGSLLPAILLGVAFGNVLRGLPLDADANYAGTFFGLLSPFPLLVGLVTVAVFVLHGAIYLALKSGDQLHVRLTAWIPRLWIVYVVLYLIATIAARAAQPMLFDDSFGDPLFWILLLPLVAAMLYIPVAARAGRHLRALLASSTVITLMIAEAALSLFPQLVPSMPGFLGGLDVYNAASTPRTLNVMMIMALAGMPLVLAYTIVIHRIFGGKVHLDESSY